MNGKLSAKSATSLPTTTRTIPLNVLKGCKPLSKLPHSLDLCLRAFKAKSSHKLWLNDVAFKAYDSHISLDGQTAGRAQKRTRSYSNPVPNEGALVLQIIQSM